MQNKERRNTVYLAVAILVAVVLWIFVDMTAENGSPRTVTKTITDIPIEYRNEDILADRGLMLLESGTDKTIDLTLSGTRWKIANLNEDEVRVTANLLDVNVMGIQRLQYTVIFPEKVQGLQKVGSSISMATVNIAELFSKNVKVYCELRGNVAAGYTAGQLQLSHTEIEVRGQKEDLDRVDYVKAVMDLGENAESTVTKELTYQFYDTEGKVISNADGALFAAEETIQAILPVSVTKELRLTMNFIEAPGVRKSNLVYEFKPSTIMVSGDADKLKNRETIDLGDFNLLDLKDGTATYTYPITLPENCQNLSGISRVTLEISFADMFRTAVPVSQFRFDNIPEGKVVSPLMEEMRVSIFGITEEVEAVTPEQITIVADLSSFGDVSGNYTVPATVEIDTNGDIGISGNYQIQIGIRDSEPTDGTADESIDQ